MRALALATTVIAFESFVISHASAEDYNIPSGVKIEQAASLLHYSGGNDSQRFEVAPNYSEELGWSLRAAAGSYLGDAVALGVIVEYGQNKQEYLANLGLQLSDSLSLIGTVGQLAEHKEFVSGEGEDKATQMEYGLSLRLDPQENLGFELNGYAADAKASNDSIETGQLYGTEALASLGLADTTLLKIGGGYEWLEWDGGEKDDHWTFRTEANQRLTDVLGLQGHAKLGASERSYGGGLNLNFSNDGTNRLGLNYTYIEGRHGITDDKRVELSWTYGFGSGPVSSAAAMDITDKSGTIRAAADVVMASPANNLLSDVLKRPSYLPERVLARAEATTCPFRVEDISGFESLTYVSSYPGGNSFVRISSTTEFTPDQLNGIGPGSFTFTLGSSTLVSSNDSGVLFGRYATALLFEPTTGDDKIFTASADGYSCSFVLDDYL